MKVVCLSSIPHKYYLKRVNTKKYILDQIGSNKSPCFCFLTLAILKIRQKTNVNFCYTHFGLKYCFCFIFVFFCSERFYCFFLHKVFFPKKNNLFFEKKKNLIRQGTIALPLILDNIYGGGWATSILLSFAQNILGKNL